MKIIHATTVPSTLNFMRGQGRFLRELGVELVYLSSPGLEQELANISSREGANHVTVSMQRAISPFHDGITLLQLWKHLRDLKPDVVHAHTPKAGLLVTAAARLSRVPVCIYHIHGLRYMTTAGVKRAILRSAERIACRLSHRVLVVSASIRDYAVDDGIVLRDKAHVIGKGTINGVDSQRYSPLNAGNGVDSLRQKLGIKPDTPVIGFVGRISRDKGIADLAQIWSRVRTGAQTPHLVIVGENDLSDSPPERELSTLKRDPRVHFVGTQADVRPYYGLFDLVAFPSHREGFGQAVLEASSCAVPSVAYDIPGIRDAIIHDETGVRVPYGDTSAFAAEIRALLAAPQRREELGKRGRRRAMTEFRPGDLMHQYWEDELSLINSKRSSGSKLEVSVSDSEISIENH